MVLLVVVLVVDVVEVDDVVVEVVLVSHEAVHTLLQHVIPVSHKPLIKCINGYDNHYFI